MENPAFQSEYKKTKKEAREIYNKIGRVWCPALNDYIVFNRTGFRHLLRKNSLPRARNEQKRRFALLPQSALILSDPFVNITHRKEGKFDFWAFTKEHNNRKIKVIIRQIGEHQKHFFSIF
jgi:hypothetical protein